jgi:hypothetical protein
VVGGALGRGVAVDEFDDRHRRHVAIAEAGLQDADIAALTVLVARAEDGEQTLDMLVLLQLRSGLTAGVQIAALGQRDQLFDDRTQFLGFRQVVLICSCSISEPAMLANSALRCSWVRFSGGSRNRDA